MSAVAATPAIVNGVDTDALRATLEAVSQDPAPAQTSWKVATHWKGGFRSDTRVTECVIGGERVTRDYTIKIDEPTQLCGTDQFANPQEYLMSALNACMLVGYVAGCSLEGIELEELRIETEGDIDLRGFLGVDPRVKAGYDTITYKVYIKGSGTAEQFQRVHEFVKRTSPNRYNVAMPINLESKLIVC